MIYEPFDVALPDAKEDHIACRFLCDWVWEVNAITECCFCSFRHAFVSQCMQCFWTYLKFIYTCRHMHFAGKSCTTCHCISKNKAVEKHFELVIICQFHPWTLGYFWIQYNKRLQFNKQLVSSNVKQNINQFIGNSCSIPRSKHTDAGEATKRPIKIKKTYNS